MHRRCPVSELEEIGWCFRRSFRETTASTDVIVGFPGESEEQFEATMELVRRVRPDIVNVTRFSPREGTPPPTMPGRIVGWKRKGGSPRLTPPPFQNAPERNERFLRREAPGFGPGPGQPGTPPPP